MKTVGTRRERTLTSFAISELLKEGARLNETLHSLPTGHTTFIPKGVYYFKTLAEADRHRDNCIAEGMAQTALARAHGRV